ncbi:MAG: SLC13 family permease [Planctomycetes bacterium]|nr:SLC13 family permease [Planctomycetota bacterium]
MSWEAWVTLAIVLVMLVALVRNWLPADLALLGAAVALVVLGFFSKALPDGVDFARAFGNEALVSVGVLFVVSAGLSETGGMAWLVQRALGHPKGVTSAQLRMMLPVAGMSAFLNNTPVVVMFMPVVQDWCKRIGIAPSKLFLPLSYAAVLGGCVTLIGTSTNLVVQGLMIDSQQPPLGLFTLAPIGLPIAALGIAFVVLASRWLLPERRGSGAQIDDPRRYTVEMMVEPASAIDGQTITEAGLRHLPGLFLSGIERGGEALVAVGPETRLRGDDRLIFVGVVESVVDLQKIRGLRPATNQVYKLDEPRHERRLVEVVASGTCPVVGKTIREGRFRNRYDAVVIAVHRDGERMQGKLGDIVLRAGDNLLLETHPSFVDKHKNSRDFYLVSGVPDSAPRRHDKALMAAAILIAMVLAASFGEPYGVTMLFAALAAAALMLILGCCSRESALREIDWSTLLAIGASFVIGRALQTSGAASALAEQMLHIAEPFGPIGVLAGVYLLTLVLTELVTNNAAAVLAFPLAHAAAQSQGLSMLPFAVCICFAASCGFATPLGYQTHMMVYGPGGYRFSDFVRIGLPLDLLVGVVAVGLIPVFFPLVP